MASNLPLGLQDYAEQVISVAGKTIAVKDLLYVSQEDMYSAAYMTVTSQAVAANTSVRVFQIKPGQTGQGWTSGVDNAVTNNENGDRFQGNEIYLSTGIGFDWMASTGTTSFQFLPITTTKDIQSLGQTFQWTWQVGSGPERIKGKLIQYPYGAGAFGVGVTMATGITVGSATVGHGTFANSNGGPNVPMRKFDTPLIFPPNIDCKINVKNGSAGTTVLSTVDDYAGAAIGGVVCIAYMKGFRMTLPV